ncbi:MAG: carbohydrate-binding domain-containing protein [Clostridia bacterium]|nr:carbohydrate-binding domain-containing protein [Clostridia bacterium]
MKKIKIPALLMCVTILFCSCSKSDNSVTGNSADKTNETTTVAEIPTDTDDMFSDRDSEGTYSENESIAVILNGASAQCSDSSVKISGGNITITADGIYAFSGTLSDGSVIVDAPETAKVQIVLKNANITSKTSAAIYAKEADKVFVTAGTGSKNTLTNGGTYSAVDDNNIDSVIFSKCDLTLNGTGSLAINAKAGHGIVSKDDLVFTNGNYAITSASHGVTGKDSIRIQNGSFNITSGKDGFHAENADDEASGFLYISDGTFNVTSDLDGFSGAAYVLIDNGTFTVKSGGGSENAELKNKNDFFMQHPGYLQNITTEDSESLKGIKTAGNLTIKNGKFNLNCADDAIHANGSVKIAGGTFNIATGDDGFHADNNLTVSGGTIKITESYEGLEGQSIDVTGGSIYLVASDDGMNAAGGNDESGFGGMMGRPDQFGTASDSSYIKISGGMLNIDASGDGIDSNGSLQISGGTTYLSGPTNSGNGALDYGSSASITGGIFICSGSSGMAQNFSSAEQGTMMVNVSTQQANSKITLTDSNNKTIVSWTSPKQFNSVIISSPEIKEGEVYTLNTGSEKTEVEMKDILYSSSGSMGNMNGAPGMPGGSMVGGKKPMGKR